MGTAQEGHSLSECHRSGQGGGSRKEVKGKRKSRGSGRKDLLRSNCTGNSCRIGRECSEQQHDSKMLHENPSATTEGLVCTLHWASAHKGSAYPQVSLGCKRISALISQDNNAAKMRTSSDILGLQCRIRPMTQPALKAFRNEILKFGLLLRHEREFIKNIPQQ